MRTESARLAPRAGTASAVYLGATFSRCSRAQEAELQRLTFSMPLFTPLTVSKSLVWTSYYVLFYASLRRA